MKTNKFSKMTKKAQIKSEINNYNNKKSETPFIIAIYSVEIFSEILLKKFIWI